MPVSTGRKRRLTVGRGGRLTKRTKWAASKGRRRTGLAKFIRSIALKQTEVKYKEVNVQNSNLFHNGGTGPNFNQTNEILTNIAQGDSSANRDGDEVYLTSLKMKLWLANKNDRPNVMYRIIIYGNIPDSGTVTDLFNATTNHTVSFVNREKYTVYYDRVVNVKGTDHSLETGATLREVSRLHVINMNLKNKKIKFNKGTNTISDSKDRWGLAIIPYDAFGTLPSDNIASFAMSYRLYFRDP